MPQLPKAVVGRLKCFSRRELDILNVASEPAIAACDVLTSSLAAILAPSSQPMRGLFALEDAEPVSVSLEAISAPEREKEKRIAALLTTVRNHPAYRALEPLDGFKRIMRSR